MMRYQRMTTKNSTPTMKPNLETKNPAPRKGPDERSRPPRPAEDDHRQRSNVSAASLLLEIEPRLAEHYSRAALEILATEFAARLLLSARLNDSAGGI